MKLQKMEHAEHETAEAEAACLRTCALGSWSARHARGPGSEARMVRRQLARSCGPVAHLVLRPPGAIPEIAP